MHTHIILGIGILVLALAPLVIIDREKTKNSTQQSNSSEGSHLLHDTLPDNETRSTRRKHIDRKILTEEEIEKLSAEQYLRHKVNNIIIPLVDFEQATIAESLDFLRLRARELDPAENETMKGLGFMIRKPSAEGTLENEAIDSALNAGAPIDSGIASIRVNTQGRNMTLGQVLDKMCHEAKLRWKIDEGKVVLERLE